MWIECISEATVSILAETILCLVNDLGLNLFHIPCMFCFRWRCRSGGSGEWHGLSFFLWEHLCNLWDPAFGLSPPLAQHWWQCTPWMYALSSPKAPAITANAHTGRQVMYMHAFKGRSTLSTMWKREANRGQMVLSHPFVQQQLLWSRDPSSNLIGWPVF